MFVEMGCGKGRLSLAVCTAVAGARLLLVDRAHNRNKADKYLRAAGADYHRIYADITHLDLGAVPMLANSSLVCISKHLCGSATDVTLTCLRSLCERESLSASRPKLAGVGIATCCHHRCTWRDYVGKTWWTDTLVPKRALGWASLFRAAHLLLSGRPSLRLTLT